MSITSKDVVVSRKTVQDAIERFKITGRRITTLYPSHVNTTGRRFPDARTRNKVDRSMSDKHPDQI